MQRQPSVRDPAHVISMYHQTRYAQYSEDISRYTLSVRRALRQDSKSASR